MIDDQRSRSVTRADVARYAGVSTAVVSYVLNNGPKPVAALTKERVLDAVRVLGYRPNAAARALSPTSRSPDWSSPNRAPRRSTPRRKADSAAGTAAASFRVLGIAEPGGSCTHHSRAEGAAKSPGRLDKCVRSSFSGTSVALPQNRLCTAVTGSS